MGRFDKGRERNAPISRQPACSNQLLNRVLINVCVDSASANLGAAFDIMAVDAVNMRGPLVAERE